MFRRISHSLALAALVLVAPALSAQAAPSQPAKPAASKPAMAKPAMTKPAMAKPAAAASKAAAASNLIDINSATAAELEAVPGIGAAYSAKIIAGRPYANKQQLVQKKILPGNVYAKVKAHLVAKQ